MLERSSLDARRCNRFIDSSQMYCRFERVFILEDTENKQKEKEPLIQKYIKSIFLN